MLFVDKRVRIMFPRGGQRSCASESKGSRASYGNVRGTRAYTRGGDSHGYLGQAFQKMVPPAAGPCEYGPHQKEVPNAHERKMAMRSSRL